MAGRNWMYIIQFEPTNPLVRLSHPLRKPTHKDLQQESTSEVVIQVIIGITLLLFWSSALAAWNCIARARNLGGLLSLGFRPLRLSGVPWLRGEPSPMALHCRCLFVDSSTSRFFHPFAASPASASTSCTLRVFQSPVFFRSQRLQSKRLSQPRHSSSTRLLVQCVSSTFGSSSNDEVERQQSSATSNIVDTAPEPVRASPWAKAGKVLLRKLLDSLWTLGKWLVIPMLALSVLSDLSYTLLQEKVLIIPIGMICGIVFAGVMRETAIELSPSIEEGRIPWHLVALGLLFVAFKFIAPYLPVWGRISVPHFANGGLWQVIVLVSDWSKKQSERGQ